MAKIGTKTIIKRDVTPPAAKFWEAQSFIGYEFNPAIGEFIDNSIDADSTLIQTTHQIKLLSGKLEIVTLM